MDLILGASMAALIVMAPFALVSIVWALLSGAGSLKTIAAALADDDADFLTPNSVRTSLEFIAGAIRDMVYGDEDLDEGPAAAEPDVLVSAPPAAAESSLPIDRVAASAAPASTQSAELPAAPVAGESGTVQ